MTKDKPASGDFIAAKISIYERILAGLLKNSPLAKEIEEDVRELVEHWRTNFPEAPLLSKTGDETMRSIFKGDA